MMLTLSSTDHFVIALTADELATIIYELCAAQIETEYEMSEESRNLIVTASNMWMAKYGCYMNADTESPFTMEDDDGSDAA